MFNALIPYMKNSIYVFLVAFISFSASSCFYDNREDLFQLDDECLTENMSYEFDIEPIINTRCYQCHDNSTGFGNLIIEGFSNLKPRLDIVLNSIKHIGNVSPMPQNEPMIPDCEIQKIEAWILDGALDN